MIRRYALDVLAVVAAFVMCLLAFEAYNSWQRLNVLWNVAVQNAQAEQARQAKLAEVQQGAKAMQQMGESKGK